MFIILFFYVNMYIKERYKYMSNKFDYYKKQIRLNKYFYSIFLGKKAMTMKYFEKAHGYSYDFKNPITFSEKFAPMVDSLFSTKVFSTYLEIIHVFPTPGFPSNVIFMPSSSPDIIFN